jgi:hypothetical protein
MEPRIGPEWSSANTDPSPYSDLALPPIQED